jgi:lycopene cyclase domain-containing protein
MYTYLLLNVFTIAGPLAYSFEKKIGYFRKWKYLFPAIAITGAFFLLWDVIFTHLGIWAFNPRFLTGYYLLNLPIEEWLFFVTVPFACVFIYESMNHFVRKDILGPYASSITVALVMLSLLIAILNIDKMYTTINFFLAALFLTAHYLLFGNRYLGRFYVAYLVHLIPFFVVNGILTSLPVVTYNDAENLGIRMGTIPIEDSIYSMSLLLLNITIYEYLKLRWVKQKS